jgi:hypothetical protein
MPFFTHSQMVWQAFNCPTTFIPPVFNSVGCLKDGSVWKARSNLSLDPLIFFNYSKCSDCGSTSPQKVLEVEGAG